jgi:putative oxidoreductase
MSGTVAMFGQWGFSPLFAYAASISELVAGIAIVLGAFMWVAAALIVIVMAVAVYAVVGPNPEGEPWMFHYIFGWGPNAIYAAAALSLAFTGAGKWSLTGLMMNRWKKRAECKDCMISYGAQCTCAEPHAPDCACTLCGCAIK